MEPVVSVQGLRKRYGPVEAVAGIDLEVQRGEIFAFLGPNGAGKTTTVEILEGFRTRTVAPGPLWREAVQQLDPAEARHFVSLAPHTSSYAWDDVYEDGLQLLLDGLEARLRG